MKKVQENKLNSLFLGIKELVSLFENIEKEKPSPEKATKLLRIYSRVVTKLIQASDIVLTKSQVVTQRQESLLKKLLKELPEFHELFALFIALSDKTEEELANLDIEDSVKEKLKPMIGNKKEIKEKEAELQKKLKNISTALQMML